MDDLLGALLRLFVNFAGVVGKLAYEIWYIGRSRPEDQRLGESLLDRDARHSWNRWCFGCFVLVLILPMIVGAIWWLTH